MLYTRNKPHKRKPNWRNIILTVLCVVLLGGSITLLAKSLPAWLSRTQPPTQFVDPSGPAANTPDANVGKETPTASPSQTPAASPSQEPTTEPSQPSRGTGTQSITIGAIGDIMMHDHELQAAKEGNDYDFTNFFSRIKPYLTWQDVVIGNLETTIAASNYNATTAPAQLLQALADCNVGVLTLANEHILDNDILGAQATVKAINDAGIQSLGAYLTGADYIKPLILTKDDLRIAVLNYTEATDQTPDGAKDTVKYLTQETFDNDIKQIKADSQGIDFVIVCVHWGTENESALTDAQKTWAQTFADNGVDVVLGTHAHLPQTLSYIQNADGSKMLVAYGLGNFLGAERSNGKDAGVILNFKLTKDFDADKKSIEEVSYTPVWVLKYSSSGKYAFEVMSSVEYSSKRYQNMSAADRTRVKAVQAEIENALGTGAGKVDTNIRTLTDGVSTIVPNE